MALPAKQVLYISQYDTREKQENDEKVAVNHTKIKRKIEPLRGGVGNIFQDQKIDKERQLAEESKKSSNWDNVLLRKDG